MAQLHESVALGEWPGVNLAALHGWNIVVDAQATESERYAAEEFQSHFAKAGDLTLPIVEPAENAKRHIYIGGGETLQGPLPGFRLEDFGPEDFRIKIGDDFIAIAGGRPRGTLYGVYTFLEDYLGVRFLTHDHTSVPPLGQWRRVGPVDRFYRPPLAFRWSAYKENDKYPEFAARRRVNTVSDNPKLGGKTGYVLINHTFGRQIPSEKYGKDHPEYYCEIDGVRRGEVDNDWFGNEPCLSNPDVLRIVTDAALKELEDRPDAQNISVSQNDNDHYCRCAACARIDEREGTPMGSVLSFVNDVADKIAKKHPDVRVGTLSYWYSRKPPMRLKPRPNVQIQLCSIECCLIHPINDPNCAKNVQFCEDLSRWSEICDKISIWNYNTNFQDYTLPCPNLRVIESNIRHFVANNSKGVFMQAAYNAQGGEFSDLRNYVISGLLWDPNRSGDELIDEFLRLHYGRAADPIRRYINRLHDQAEASELHPNCFGSAKDYGVDKSFAESAVAAFEEALALAESEEIQSRVEKASICAYRAVIEPVWTLDEEKKPDPAMLQRCRMHVKRFFELCHKYCGARIGETTELQQCEDRLRRNYGLSPSQPL
jgi:hypothetical protein